MKLSVIIISYNTSSLLRNCLKSIFKALSLGKLKKTAEVIVIDNASIDDSCEMVRKNFPQVRLIQNQENLGFSKGNNQGIKKSKGKYILLLNSDTQVANDALFELVREIETNKNIGVVGGRLLNPDGTLQPSAGFFPELSKILFWMTFIDDLPWLNIILKPYHQQNPQFYEKQQNVDWVSGAFFLVKKKVISKALFLDEKIFMYGEEVEWCYRIKKSGFTVKYNPSIVTKHYKGASGVGREAGIIEEFSYLTYFFKRYKPNWQLLLLKILLIFGAMLRILVFGIIGRNKKKASLYAKAIKMVG